MDAPYNLISTISPEKGKRIDEFDKYSKYIVLYAEHPDIGKLDTYFFSIAFLYRHCLEVGLKAIGFQYIDDVVERKNFVKETRHNLSEIFDVIVNKSDSIRLDEELEWLKKYFDDLSQTDRESDSYRFSKICK